MNITRRWCDLEFYLAATNVLIPCEDAKAREVSMTAASAPSHESPVRRRQTAGAGGRSRRQICRAHDFPFLIFHLPFGDSPVSPKCPMAATPSACVCPKWQMKNEK